MSRKRNRGNAPARPAASCRVRDGVAELEAGTESVLVYSVTNEQVARQVGDSDVFYVNRKINRLIRMQMSWWCIYTWVTSLPKGWRFSCEGMAQLFIAHPKTIGRRVQHLERLGLMARGQLWEERASGTKGLGRAVWVRFEQPVSGAVAERVLRSMGCKRIITDVESMPATMGETPEELVRAGLLLSADAEARKQHARMMALAAKKGGSLSDEGIRELAVRTLGSEAAADLFMELWSACPAAKRHAAGHKHTAEAISALSDLLSAGYAPEEISDAYGGYLAAYAADPSHRDASGETDWRYLRQLPVALRRDVPERIEGARRKQQAEQRRAAQLAAAEQAAARKAERDAVLARDPEYAALKAAYDRAVGGIVSAQGGLAAARAAMECVNEIKACMTARAAELLGAPAACAGA